MDNERSGGLMRCTLGVGGAWLTTRALALELERAREVVDVEGVGAGIAGASSSGNGTRSRSRLRDAVRPSVLPPRDMLRARAGITEGDIGRWLVDSGLGGCGNEGDFGRGPAVGDLARSGDLGGKTGALVALSLAVRRGLVRGAGLGMVVAREAGPGGVSRPTRSTGPRLWERLGGSSTGMDGAAAASSSFATIASRICVPLRPGLHAAGSFSFSFSSSSWAPCASGELPLSTPRPCPSLLPACPSLDDTGDDIPLSSLPRRITSRALANACVCARGDVPALLSRGESDPDVSTRIRGASTDGTTGSGDEAVCTRAAKDRGECAAGEDVVRERKDVAGEVDGRKELALVCVRKELALVCVRRELELVNGREELGLVGMPDD